MTDIPSLPSAQAPASATGGINLDMSRLQSRANLEAAGKKFEAVFTGMMVKSMRSTHLAEDTLFGSKGMDTFKEMQDTQMAQHMADTAPLGIGKAMTAFLAKSQKDLQPESPFKNAQENAFRDSASPLPLPATQTVHSMGGREGERAGTANLTKTTP